MSESLAVRTRALNPGYQERAIISTNELTAPSLRRSILSVAADTKALQSRATVPDFYAKMAALTMTDEFDSDSDDGPAQPQISLALLQARPRFLTAEILAEVIAEAWGGTYTTSEEGDDSTRDGFVTGGDNEEVYFLSSPHGMFMIHNQPAPYWENVEAVADDLIDLRLRKPVLEHEAWIAIDLLVPFHEDEGTEAYYAIIIRLIIELADDETLAVYRPATGQINVWDDDVFEALLRPGGADEFHESSNVPVIPISEDDPEMIAAVEEARTRWPEFVEAFQNRTEDQWFSLKAPVTVGENTEFIWIEVTGLEPDYVHGTLGNDPIDLGGLRLGDTVEVAVADLNDWAIRSLDSEPVGLFTLDAIDRAQKRFFEERDLSEEE
ncbi:MAG: hypothetical protein ACI9R3_002256 [Verrucomicrobiales bacterium]